MGQLEGYRGNALDRYIDSAHSVLYVTEAKYTGGALVRQQWPEEEAERRFKFLSERASTDWVKLFRVEITRTWELVKEKEAGVETG